MTTLRTPYYHNPLIADVRLGWFVADGWTTLFIRVHTCTLGAYVKNMSPKGFLRRISQAGLGSSKPDTSRDISREAPTPCARRTKTSLIGVTAIKIIQFRVKRSGQMRLEYVKLCSGWSNGVEPDAAQRSAHGSDLWLGARALF